MDKKVKLSIISASVIAVLGVAGGVYYRVDQLQQKRDYFQARFDKTKAMLPKAVVIEKTSESTLFETNSKYVVQIVKDGQKTTSKLVINSHLEHGFSYLLSGVIEGNATGKIEGPFAKEFKSLDKLFDSQIKVLADDTLVTDTKFANLVAKDGTEIKGITSSFEATRDDENIKTNFKIASLASPKQEGQPSLFVLKGLDLEYNGKSNQIGNNHLGFKVADIQSPVVQINNIALVADSTVKSGSVDITSSLTIAKVNAPTLKDGSVDFKYSVLGIDESAMKTLYSIGQKTTPTNDEEVQKGIVAMEEQLKKIFTHGIQVNIDKLAFKAGDDNFNFSFKSSLPKLKTFEEVSFEKNLKVSYNLETKGNISNIMAEQLNQRLQSMSVNASVPPEPQIIVTNNELKVNFEINNGKGQLNGKDLTSDEQDVIHIVLSTIDEKLHSKEAFAKDAVVPTTSTSAPVDPVAAPTKTEAPKIESKPEVKPGVKK